MARSRKKWIEVKRLLPAVASVPAIATIITTARATTAVATCAAAVAALASGTAVGTAAIVAARGIATGTIVAGAATTVIALAIVALATTTGAGFNPVRGLAPDVVSGDYAGLLPLIVGPLLGGLGAGLLFRIRAVPPVTGKLTHDPTLTCYLGCQLPHDEAAALHPEGARP